MWKIKIIRVRSDYETGFKNLPEFCIEDGWEPFAATEDPTSYEALLWIRRRANESK